MLSVQFEKFGIPATLLNISFLAFSSQLLLSRIAPEPLRTREAGVFNALIACSLVCYARACGTDPGYILPKQGGNDDGRWCTKCDLPKHPRSHHCRICKRFVLLVSE